MTWRDILARWSLVEADLHQVYGIDLDDRRILRRRTWRWFEVRIRGLLTTDTRLRRALVPDPPLPELPGVPRY